MKTKNVRAAKTRGNRAPLPAIAFRWAAMARRTAMATEFRDRLVSQLPPASRTASSDALIELAVSTYVQVAEGTAAYLRANMPAPQVDRLTIARGQLQRALKGLGLIERAKDDAAPPSLETILEGVDVNA